MSTYSQIIYQIVFSTFHREATLDQSIHSNLFSYMSGILSNKKCHLYRIGGFTDHLHIVTHLHPSIPLASLVKDIKLASSDYIRKNKLLPRFNGWQEGYGAFTYSFRDKDKLIEYVKNQEKHHIQISSREEFIGLLDEHGIDFDDKFLI